MLLEFVFHVILCSVLCTIIHLFFHKKHDKCVNDLTEEELLKIKAWLATEPNLNTDPLNIIYKDVIKAETIHSCKCKTHKSCCQRD